MLPDDECGRLILALLEYAQTGALPAFAPASATAMLFSCMRAQLDRDVEKYADICAKNRQNVHSRWNKHDTTVCDGIRTNTNDTKEKEKVKEKEKDLFAQFWAAYPKRKDRAKAQKAFAKLHPDEQLLTEILAALDWQKKTPDWLKDGGQFVPYAATYLNGRRWEDEPPQNEMPARQAASDLMWALDENGRKYAVERK